MNKPLRIALFLFFLVLFLSAKADDDSSYLQTVNTEAAKIEQPILERQQQKEALEAAQQAQAAQARAQAILQSSSHGSTSAAPLGIPAAPTEPSYATATNTCDCYDNSDASNTVADNFLYDQNGQRTVRKSPACKCLAKNSNSNSTINTPTTVINPIANTSNSNDNQSTNSQKSAPQQAPIDFGIKY